MLNKAGILPNFRQKKAPKGAFHQNNN